eukprot:TRINITY_DN13213_c0_g1_i2.p2 TRINITY_DN13213_c0_g1~~TRINITY_DN13213_c0_g1_i2.p2  ORF type:complete len:161 (-),score=16.19 TRINITY_DN13213_c0_g1_i2:132-614(-)
MLRLWTFFFFFKQKTAYEIMPSLVGSEMCIRDRYQRRVHGVQYLLALVNCKKASFLFSAKFLPKWGKRACDKGLAIIWNNRKNLSARPQYPTKTQLFVINPKISTFVSLYIEIPTVDKNKNQPFFISKKISLILGIYKTNLQRFIAKQNAPKPPTIYPID